MRYERKRRKKGREKKAIGEQRKKGRETGGEGERRTI
jgi:hypothetical protein